jgi:HD-like signal output (HDOD) protein
VHNIGVLPILTEAERHADVFTNTTFLNTAMEKMAGKLGASITTEWGFEPEFVNVAYNWKDFSINSDGVSYLDIVRLGAVCAAG